MYFLNKWHLFYFVLFTSVRFLGAPSIYTKSKLKININFLNIKSVLMQPNELKESINVSGERVFGKGLYFSFCGDQAFLHD